METVVTTVSGIINSMSRPSSARPTALNAGRSQPMPQRPQSAQSTRRPPAAATGSGAGAVAAAVGGSGAGAVAAALPMRRNPVGNCAAAFFSGTPTQAVEPSSARIAKLRQEINSRSPLMHTPPPDFNATVAPPEKLADLQHPDAAHLLLGINLEGLREACELVGFPFDFGKDAWVTGVMRIGYKYTRYIHPEMAWLDEAYPTKDDFMKYLGYDFCCAVKTWLKANGHENESICQVLLKRGSKNVRPANLFYSHTQGVYLPHTIERMREGIAAHRDKLPQPTEAAKALAAEQRARLSELDALIEAARAAKDNETRKKLRAEQDTLTACPADESHLFFWLDYTSLKQCVHDFDLARVRQLIKEIGLTLAELDIDPQTYLTRSFCILELLATVQGDAELLVQMNFLKAFDVTAELAARPVDAKAAQTRREKDKATIDGFVEAMPGGFETLNATITEAIKKAAAAIAEQYSALEIDLEKKGLTAHDATVVAEILKSNTSVMEVDLHWNTEIGDEGAKAFAEALKVNATLKELILYDCGIGGVGAAAFAESLRSNTSLTLLNLDGNEEIGDKGAKALAEALKVNTTVKELILGECCIGDDGAAALAEALRSNTSLTRLYLKLNRGIGEQGKQLLRDAVAGREGFKLHI